MSTISTPDSLKMVREHLCLAQARLSDTGGQDARARDAITRLIADIDRQRPLSPDGRHGDQHTMTCGCEPGRRGAPFALPMPPGDNWDDVETITLGGRTYRRVDVTTVDRLDWGVAWFGVDRTPGTCHRCQRAAMVHQGYNGCAAVGTFCSACKAPVLRGEK